MSFIESMSSLELLLSAVVLVQFCFLLPKIFKLLAGVLVEVNLLHCEIQRVWLNLESGDRAGIKVYDQQAGIFAPNLTLDEQNEVVAESLQKIKQKAYHDWDVILKVEKRSYPLRKS